VAGFSLSQSFAFFSLFACYLFQYRLYLKPAQHTINKVNPTAPLKLNSYYIPGPTWFSLKTLLNAIKLEKSRPLSDL